MKDDENIFAVCDELQVHPARLPRILLAGHGKLRPQSPHLLQYERQVNTKIG